MARIRLSPPHASQLDVISNQKRFNVLECGRRWGKTRLGQDRIINAAIPGYPCGWFSPTFKYLTEVWRELTHILAPATAKISQQEKRLDLIGGGVIECWSLDAGDAGRSRKYKLIVIDEAGIVRDLESQWQEAIRPTLTDLKGSAWFLGTPKGRNFFHRLFNRGENGTDADWKSWRLPTIANPYIDPLEVEAARRDMPESAFAQEYLGVPADDGGNPFGMAAIARCVQEKPPLTEPVAYGIDLAKSQDWTVVCGLDASGNVTVLHRWQADWGQTRRRILDIIVDKPALADSTGVGDPIVEDLARQANVTGYHFTSPSKQKLMEGLSAAIQRGEISFPDGWLRNELDTFEYNYVGSRVVYSAPVGLHDDGVCGLSLAVECLRVVPQFTQGAWG